MKKRILTVNTSNSRGGAAKIATSLNDSLKEREEFISNLLVAKKMLDDECTHQLPLSNRYTRFLTGKIEKYTGLLDLLQIPSFFIRFSELYKNADLLHFHNLHGNYFNLRDFKKLVSKKPSVWTLHDMQAFTGHCAYSLDCHKWVEGCNNCPQLNIYPEIKIDTTDYLWNFKKNIYDESNFTVVCVSEWLKKQVETSILKDKEPKVIYNGIDTDIYKKQNKEALRKELNLPENKFIVLFSANMAEKDARKGFVYLEKLYDELKSHENFYFLNIGSSSKKNKNLNNWNDIEYIFDQEEMAKYYSAADLFIFPSLAETFGLVAAESMACGTPVVAFDNTAVPEVVKHLKNGYLAKNKDVNDLINGVKILEQDSILREKLAQNAVNFVKTNFSLDKMVNNYISLYEDLIEKSNRKSYER